MRFKIQILNEEYKTIIFLFEAEGIVNILIHFPRENFMHSCTKKNLMQYKQVSRNR